MRACMQALCMHAHVRVGGSNLTAGEGSGCEAAASAMAPCSVGEWSWWRTASLQMGSYLLANVWLVVRAPLWRPTAAKQLPHTYRHHLSYPCSLPEAGSQLQRNQSRISTAIRPRRQWVSVGVG